ncbi:cytochrome c oxidase subunit 6b-3-like, partial [Magnolia sinica]|uniref:cytochrome c oxidase subunit 6b-3-like n=1 Tax=Magnolia sinica TaxID=86752 RepID=UPI002658D3AF
LDCCHVQKYLLQEKEEQSDQGESPVEATEDEKPTNADAAVAAIEEVVTEKIDETPAAEESSEAPEPEESEEKLEIKIETAPADFRFPTTNQTRHCFTRYVEYHRCTAAKGEGAPECDKFAKYYRSLCPGDWIDRWNEQRENGTFPGPL